MISRSNQWVEEYIRWWLDEQGIPLLPARTGPRWHQEIGRDNASMLWLSCWTFLTQLDTNVWHVCVTAAEVVMRSSFSLLGVVIERLATTLQELLSWVTWLRELAYQPWFPTRIRHQSRVPFDTHLFLTNLCVFEKRGVISRALLWTVFPWERYCILIVLYLQRHLGRLNVRFHGEFCTPTSVAVACCWASIRQLVWKYAIHFRSTFC